MRRPQLATPRIRLEPMRSVHLPLLVELDADPEVLRHLLGRARTADEVHTFWGPVCADTAADAVGLGYWVGHRVADGDFLGWWDLSPAVPVPGRPTRAEAGWRLARRHWDGGTRPRARPPSSTTGSARSACTRCGPRPWGSTRRAAA